MDGILRNMQFAQRGETPELILSELILGALGVATHRPTSQELAARAAFGAELRRALSNSPEHIIQINLVPVTMAHAEAGTIIAPLNARPLPDTICLFDVDETLSKARRSATPQMLQTLSALRHKCATGFVGGSNLVKQQEQLGTPSINVTSLFDFCFPENGLVAFRMGEVIESASFIGWLGEEKYKKLTNFVLKYVADLDIPIKRGTFIEFRNGMINISPIGRNATIDERNAYEKYDLAHGIRTTFVKALKTQFPDYGLTYSIGGQISFDVFPTGWDKRYCLKHVAAEKERSGVEYTKIHFFGDKTFEGGNDYEIFSDERTIGHSVKDPDDTLKQIKELFGV